jgi:RNA polymerase-binding transcription factor DksA
MANTPNSLQNVKRLLFREKREVEKELKNLKKGDPFFQEERLTSNEPATDAQEFESHERITAQAATLNRILLQIKKALSRIGVGKYGKCEKCGREIGPERLKVLPAATLCLVCERELEAKGRA